MNNKNNTLTNLEIIASTEAFKTYIEDLNDLYADMRYLDKWQLVKQELQEKGYIINTSAWDLREAWLHDSINELPQIEIVA